MCKHFVLKCGYTFIKLCRKRSSNEATLICSHCPLKVREVKELTFYRYKCPICKKGLI